eukprot:8065513-Pyramimonas_sp.AAC.1
MVQRICAALLGVHSAPPTDSADVQRHTKLSKFRDASAKHASFDHAENDLKWDVDMLHSIVRYQSTETYIVEGARPVVLARRRWEAQQTQCHVLPLVVGAPGGGNRSSNSSPGALLDPLVNPC